MKKEEPFCLDESRPTMIGHILIRDPDTDEVIIDQRDRPVKKRLGKIDDDFKGK